MLYINLFSFTSIGYNHLRNKLSAEYLRNKGNDSGTCEFLRFKVLCCQTTLFIANIICFFKSKKYPTLLSEARLFMLNSFVICRVGTVGTVGTAPQFLTQARAYNKVGNEESLPFAPDVGHPAPGESLHPDNGRRRILSPDVLLHVRNQQMGKPVCRRKRLLRACMRVCVSESGKVSSLSPPCLL